VRSYVYCHDDPADCADPSGLAGVEPNPETGLMEAAGLDFRVGQTLDVNAESGTTGDASSPDAALTSESPTGGNDAPTGSDQLIPPPAPTGRELPGYATGGFNLSDTDTLLGGTGRNAGKIPRRIANVLRGHWFKNFDAFRHDFWKAIADAPEIARDFDQSSRTLM